jgi:hypothetical protein
VRPVQGIHRETGLETMLPGWDDHGKKIRTRKQRTDAGIYSFVNRTIKDLNRLLAGVLTSL